MQRHHQRRLQRQRLPLGYIGVMLIHRSGTLTIYLGLYIALIGVMTITRWTTCRPASHRTLPLGGFYRQWTTQYDEDIPRPSHIGKPGSITECSYLYVAHNVLKLLYIVYTGVMLFTPWASHEYWRGALTVYINL